MRILYLLFPLLLLLVHSAAGERDTGEMAEGEPPTLGLADAGSFLEPTNREQCQKENGYCGFVKCRFPFVIKGKCSTFFFCCQNLWG
ncbi:antimicrobial peptide THP1-like isoform 1-T3 [Acridotheres tristis]